MTKKAPRHVAKQTVEPKEEANRINERQGDSTMPKYTVRGDGTLLPLEDKPLSRCRKWQIRVAVGKREDGKYHTKCRTVTGTKSEAMAAKRDFIAELVNGSVFDPSSITVSECCDKFLADYSAGLTESGNVTKYTIQSTKTALNRIKDSIGNEKFSSLTVETVDSMLRAMRNSSGMSSGTVRQIRAKGVLMARWAEAKGISSASVWEKSENPSGKPQARRSASIAQTRDLAARLMDVDDPSFDGKRIAAMLCLCCGLRRGEACGLTWGDVDLDSRVLHVRHGTSPDGSLKKTKTPSGVRDIPMPPAVVECLNSWKGMQRDQFCMLVSQTKDTRVCTSGTTNVSPNTIVRWWKDCRSRFGTDLTLHELRHTYLTSLARAGVHPRVMQALAGHSTSRLVMEVYTHVNIEDMEKAVSSLSDSLDLG